MGAEAQPSLQCHKSGLGQSLLLRTQLRLTDRAKGWGTSGSGLKAAPPRLVPSQTAGTDPASQDPLRLPHHANCPWSLGFALRGPSRLGQDEASSPL